MVSRIDLEESEVSVEFDGREVIYGFGDLDELVLAYATTSGGCRCSHACRG